METSETSNNLENSEGSEQKCTKERSTEKETLVEELSSMGFSKSLVQQVKCLNN